ncbi:hypothetical protein CBS101457_006807 [Exobasidium rhododendri]|nr:hypothetical protein CBS101457_006807 [Exobasidium rhododendri]
MDGSQKCALCIILGDDTSADCKAWGGTIPQPRKDLSKKAEQSRSDSEIEETEDTDSSTFSTDNDSEAWSKVRQIRRKFPRKSMKRPRHSYDRRNKTKGVNRSSCSGDETITPRYEKTEGEFSSQRSEDGDSRSETEVDTFKGRSLMQEDVRGNSEGSSSNVTCRTSELVPMKKGVEESDNFINRRTSSLSARSIDRRQSDDGVMDRLVQEEEEGSLDYLKKKCENDKKEVTRLERRAVELKIELEEKRKEAAVSLTTYTSKLTEELQLMAQPEEKDVSLRVVAEEP